MEDADFLGRGWKFPVSVKDGKIASSEGEDSIRESIMIILGTAKGERVMRPDFGCGINELVFAPNNTSTATLIDFYIREALLKWEPRIEVLNVITAPDKDEGNKLILNIEYMVKTTNTKSNMVYPFYLERGGI
ncbi:phage baseplate assembly protein W [Candidatus Methanoperedens nitroreducens]|uniref:Phage baseplate assembly protein W n=1 Tax=Candidatus Methanoperedens nitratireducens TaxID=1392998 RepID=A0A062UZG7_9EURY|nr:GPW/gp25 family protein [Candidatus Methanoperedens nitroreducens]KCZ70547.1 phage baseplate assembly protein W [Candidatus Methanoperedens nitroreducens]MDJ1420399.1 GPW/gp25 family protein [Candidatus Methanoperedens sp.]